MSRLTQILALSSLALAGADIPAGVLHVPVKGHRKSSNMRSLAKRASSGEDDLDLDNYDMLYGIELEMGSNKQKVTVQIDTGSSDLWVMSPKNPLCKHYTDDPTEMVSQGDIVCYSGSLFDPSKSSSYSENSTKLVDTYGDGTMAVGYFAQDTITLGDITLENANFAVATQANSTNGILGIGPLFNEGTVDIEGTIYQNIPYQLYDKGLVSSYGYSLWLNDLYSNEGSLLFGGVDHAKYSGTLSTVPMIYDKEILPFAQSFYVMLNGIDIYQGSNSESVVDIQYPFLLDSGTSFIQLPTIVVAAITESLGGTEDDSGDYIVPCGVEGGLSFDFSGAKIQVPFSELTAPLDDGSDACLLLITADDANQILGDTFLRSAYVVFDMFNNEIAIANTKYNATSSNIEAFGTDGVPSATQAASYSNTETNDQFTTHIVTGLSLPSEVSASGDYSVPSTADGYGQGPTNTAQVASESTFGKNTKTVASSVAGGIGGALPTKSSGSDSSSSSQTGKKKNGASSSNTVSLLSGATGAFFIAFSVAIFC